MIKLDCVEDAVWMLPKYQVRCEITNLTNLLINQEMKKITKPVSDVVWYNTKHQLNLVIISSSQKSGV